MALFKAALLPRMPFNIGKAKNYNVSGCAAGAQDDRLKIMRMQTT